jgi:hypothetical protein
MMRWPKVANNKNLVPLSGNNERTKRIATKGGKASGEQRQKRMLLREAYNSIALGEYKPIGKTAELIAEKFGNITLEEAIMLSMIVEATSGSVAAATWIRDTVEGKPKQDMQPGNGIDVNITWDNEHNQFKDLTTEELRQLAGRTEE